MPLAASAFTRSICYAGADPAPPACAVTVFTETAWHALFIRNLLIRPRRRRRRRDAGHHPPSARASRPIRRATARAARRVIALDMSRNIVLIGGTAYAGEIKKSVFSLFNFHAPRAGVLPMHCSANIGQRGRCRRCSSASRAPARRRSPTIPSAPLIGDDEHGWSADWRLQSRGRLLRQDRQAQRRARSPKSSRRPDASARCWRMSCSTRRLARRLRRYVADREHPRGLSARDAARGRRRAASAARRRRSCSSPPTPSACCRRSRG